MEEQITNQQELINAYAELNELNLDALPSLSMSARIQELEQMIFEYQHDCPLFEMGKDYTLDDIINAQSHGGVDDCDGWEYRYCLPEGLDIDSYAEIDYPAFETILLFECNAEDCQSLLVFFKISDRFYRLIAKDIDGGEGKTVILGDEKQS